MVNSFFSLLFTRGLSRVQVDKPWYNYFIPHELVYTLHITGYFVLKVGKGGNKRLYSNIITGTELSRILPKDRDNKDGTGDANPKIIAYQFVEAGIFFISKS